ncbi:hypothetical protein [Gelidibacter japonicus]|uniref:hypothetical protein n=1 Tax=Gelidibacter japonicus TaxID=1962232 RepID=UPI002AFE27AD|nr:hypothetical protein [Gelidibacter japonicus]
MRTLKKLFGFRDLKNPHELNSTHIPSKELFIDSSIPNEPGATEKISTNSINIFLNKNYYQNGINDGFSMHSNEAAHSRKQAIKSDFRNLLVQLINQNKEDILHLTNSTVEVANLSLELKEKLENKIQFLSNQIDEYNQQMELSSQNEGLVMSAIHNYHQGFLSGMKSYLEMENLIFKN